MTTFVERETVIVQQCWGCNRLRAPKPWASPTMVNLLRSEQRLRIEEYQCQNADCPTWKITGDAPLPAVVLRKGDASHSDLGNAS